MKSIDSRDAQKDLLSFFDNERKARLSVIGDKHVDILVDVFTVDTRHYMILKQKSNS